MLAALALALSLSAQPAASPDAATAAPEVRQRVKALLGAIDRPIPPEAWRALGPGAEGALAEVAASDDFPSRRALALEGVAAFGVARAEALHRRLASDTSTPAPVRRAAIRGLAILLPPSGAAEALRPLLSGDRDPSVRRAAAEALSEAAPASSCADIRAQARREGARGDAMFRRALAACAR